MRIIDSFTIGGTKVGASLPGMKLQGMLGSRIAINMASQTLYVPTKHGIVQALNDEIDDGGASWEAVVHYHIACPYMAGDKRGLCENFEISRDTCVECKAMWLQSQVDEEVEIGTNMIREKE